MASLALRKAWICSRLSFSASCTWMVNPQHAISSRLILYLIRLKVDLPFVQAYDSPQTVRGRSIFSMANQSVSQDALVGQPLGHYRIVGIMHFLSTNQTHGG